MSKQPLPPTDRTSFRARLREHWQMVEGRVTSSTRAHRMASRMLRVVDGTGQPLAGARIRLEQVQGSIRYGANSFLLGGNGSPAADQRWEDLFASVFDLAVVPFFWKDLEPEQGYPRFASDSPQRYRRPPPDAVLDFCRRRGVEPKAHALTYHQFTPDWMPPDPEQCKRHYEDWYAQVGSRYHRQIPSWDVVNEALTRWGWINDVKPLPADWIRWSFEAARRHFPGCRLILNESTDAWAVFGYNFFGRETHPYVLLVENLLLKGVPIDEIGLQFHLFDWKSMQEKDLYQKVAGAKDQLRLLEPGYLLQVLDHYARFGKPLHISEITVPCFGEDEDAQALQAEIAEMLYRTWFSHPAVASIVWWNVVDGHAHGNEGGLRGGLVNKDLSEKAVYRTLKRLIREEWRSGADGQSDSEGRLVFTGYHGGYAVTIEHAGRRWTHSLSLDKGVPEPVILACPEAGGSAISGASAPAAAS